MGTLLQDVRYGLPHAGQEAHIHDRGVLTLALGVGASTTTFIIVDAVLLRSQWR